MSLAMTTAPTAESGKVASSITTAATELSPLTAAELGSTVFGGFIVMVLSAIGIYCVCLNVTKILNKHKNTRLVIPEMPPSQEEQQKDFAQEHVNENQRDQDTLPVFIQVRGNQVPPVHCPSHPHSTTDDEKENSSSGMATSSDYVLGGCETKCSGSSSVEVIYQQNQVPESDDMNSGVEAVMAPVRVIRHSYRESRPSCCSLVYSPCPGFHKSFPRLIGNLQATVPQDEPWLLLGRFEENARLAEFPAGPEGGTLVTIGVLDCSLVMKAKVMSGKTCFTEIRSWVEDGILETHSDLPCSIYVSPCTTGSGKDWPNVVCVHNSTKLGSLGKAHTNTQSRDEDIKMINLYCPQHRKVLRPERYQHWFGFSFEQHHLRDSFKRNEEKILLNIAKEIRMTSALYEIAMHLGVPTTFVEVRMITSPNDFTVVALQVLQRWHRKQRGQCLHYQLKDQLASAFEAAGLDKESVYHVYQLIPKNPV